jgi:hypothetical protein
MVNIVKGADFTLMMECMPEIGQCHSVCTLWFSCPLVWDVLLCTSFICLHVQYFPKTSQKDKVKNCIKSSKIHRQESSGGGVHALARV